MFNVCTSVWKLYSGIEVKHECVTQQPCSCSQWSIIWPLKTVLNPLFPRYGYCHSEIELSYLSTGAKELIVPIITEAHNDNYLYTGRMSNSQYPSYQSFVSRRAHLPETPLQSQHPWISHTGNCNYLCEPSFQCMCMNSYDTDIWILKSAPFEYDHHFAIKQTFYCKIKIWNFQKIHSNEQ